ncbi:glycosyltransferase family 2 protein [Tulasnella calospora MUT 4182]|uniref:Glycosyltransferase family 2 protein n=1 Tax=Tulasnella calospora MUT 4182 TaxID=1051891 RepID=A0A0C3QM79_9AGAM|nr:glycosyltransferase family 2 protein [Tulasnella calospora MUT 4182]
MSESLGRTFQILPSEDIMKTFNTPLMQHKPNKPQQLKTCTPIIDSSSKSIAPSFDEVAESTKSIESMLSVTIPSLSNISSPTRLRLDDALPRLPMLIAYPAEVNTNSLGQERDRGKVTLPTASPLALSSSNVFFLVDPLRLVSAAVVPLETENKPGDISSPIPTIARAADEEEVTSCPSASSVRLPRTSTLGLALTSDDSSPPSLPNTVEREILNGLPNLESLSSL